MVLQLSTLLILNNRVHQNSPVILLLLLLPKPSLTTRNIMTGIYPLILHLWFFIWLLCIIMLLCKNDFFTKNIQKGFPTPTTRLPLPSLSGPHTLITHWRLVDSLSIWCWLKLFSLFCLLLNPKKKSWCSCCLGIISWNQRSSFFAKEYWKVLKYLNIFTTQRNHILESRIQLYF